MIARQKYFPRHQRLTPNGSVKLVAKIVFVPVRRDLCDATGGSFGDKEIARRVEGESRWSG